MPGDDIGQVRFERTRQHDEIESPAQSADQLAMYPFHSATAGKISDYDAHHRTGRLSHQPDPSCRHGSWKRRPAIYTARESPCARSRPAPALSQSLLIGPTQCQPEQPGNGIQIPFNHWKRVTAATPSTAMLNGSRRRAASL